MDPAGVGGAWRGVELHGKSPKKCREPMGLAVCQRFVKMNDTRDPPGLPIAPGLGQVHPFINFFFKEHYDNGNEIVGPAKFTAKLPGPRSPHRIVLPAWS